MNFFSFYKKWKNLKQSDKIMIVFAFLWVGTIIIDLVSYNRIVDWIQMLLILLIVPLSYIFGWPSDTTHTEVYSNPVNHSKILETIENLGFELKHKTDHASQFIKRKNRFRREIIKLSDKSAYLIVEVSDKYLSNFKKFTSR